jgi:hypothetical protein
MFVRPGFDGSLRANLSPAVGLGLGRVKLVARLLSRFGDPVEYGGLSSIGPRSRGRGVPLVVCCILLTAEDVVAMMVLRFAASRAHVRGL